MTGTILAFTLLSGCGWDPTLSPMDKSVDIDWVEMDRLATVLFDISCHENGAHTLEDLYRTPDQDAYVRLLPRNIRYLLLVDLVSGHQTVYFAGADIGHPVELALRFLSPRIYDSELGALLQSELASSVNVAVDDLELLLDPNAAVSVAGYSLGGAVAALAGAKLLQRGYAVDSVVTLGQGPVTDAHGAQNLAAVPLLRVVAGRDWATMCYHEGDRHFGATLILLRGPDFAYLEMGDTFYAMAADPEVGPTDFFCHTNYLPHLRDKLAGAKQVPYRLPLLPLTVRGLFPCDFSAVRE